MEITEGPALPADSRIRAEPDAATAEDVPRGNGSHDPAVGLQHKPVCADFDGEADSEPQAAPEGPGHRRSVGVPVPAVDPEPPADHADAHAAPFVAPFVVDDRRLTVQMQVGIRVIRAPQAGFDPDIPSEHHVGTAQVHRWVRLSAGTVLACDAPVGWCDPYPCVRGLPAGEVSPVPAVQEVLHRSPRGRGGAGTVPRDTSDQGTHNRDDSALSKPHEQQHSVSSARLPTASPPSAAPSPSTVLPSHGKNGAQPIAPPRCD